jgi:hypothetical protein
MKSKVITLSLLLLTITGFGQDTATNKKIKEFYLGAGTFSPLAFHLKYKKQIGKRTFFKVGLIDLYGSTNLGQPHSSTPHITNRNFSAGLETGIEFRKPLSNRFTFFHGPSIRYIYSGRYTTTHDPTIPNNHQKSENSNHAFGIPYALGLLFNITNNLLVAAEINPGLFGSVDYSKSAGRSTSSSPYLSFGFDNRYVLLSVAYRP